MIFLEKISIDIYIDDLASYFKVEKKNSEDRQQWQMIYLQKCQYCLLTNDYSFNITFKIQGFFFQCWLDVCPTDKS